ncbi:MAG: 2-succinyl-5-enolpyruvyl-6-hydroxy-3-cyclohexene-1-carboxylate synthase [Clostridia bacterium]|nr:2-succinyl-5-enolpyruvyl-6-hydroxy-3-cyclohexene-1-carboxylate synthase [Bacilli bacterium]MBR3511501.1 2-succinyl-5-enolpyruvyl-6-hydroxy-3-cyclohexene-1-carboxylate synthase [Clostridia bacterium]
MYTILENARIVISLLKKHNIRHIVLSPGGSNIPIVQAVQQDPFFKCYSVVDERSAMYFAIGLYLKTGEIIATSCTSANATRNYIPGLTEAYYKHVPILALTMSKHPMYLSQEYMQCPIQTSLPVDAIKKSYSIPRIKDDYDRAMCIRIVNEAILELNHCGTGPVQLNIEELDSETWEFDKNAVIPEVRMIERYNNVKKDINLKQKKIMILIGENTPVSDNTYNAIEKFSNCYDVMIYTNHLSNYHGKYSLNANLLIGAMSQEVFNSELKPDILITVGGITGDYNIYKRLFSLNKLIDEHWRISEDGNVVDTYNQLTRIYQMSIEDFFKGWLDNDEINDHTYYKKWLLFENNINRNIELPFSNIYAAQQLCERIPANSYMNYAILNSLRSWLLFNIDESIKCFSNVASFGIDGCLSTFLGESVDTEELCFLIIGDLSFYYDMNAIGIRHIKNNVRILLVNNNGGVEFKLGNLQYKTDVGSYIAADNHFKNAEGWARTQGFDYISATNKESFNSNINSFLGESEKPIIFEIFTDPEDEKRATTTIIDKNRNETFSEEMKSNLKKSIKTIMGDKNASKIKDLLKKKK